MQALFYLDCRPFSFADVLKQQPKPPPVRKEEPPAVNATTAAAAAVPSTKSRRPKLEQMRPPRRSGPNKISAATFAQIGRSGEEEKYVMGSDSGTDRTESRQERSG